MFDGGLSVMYSVNVVCDSLEKTADFVLWACGFLSRVTNLRHVHFSFICVGSAEDFQKFQLDKGVVDTLVSSAYPECGVPSFDVFLLTGYKDTARCADMVKSTMKIKEADKYFIFVDLSKSVVKMVNLSSALVDDLKSAGIQPYGCLTYYLSDELAKMCASSSFDDGLCCGCFNKFFCIGKSYQEV